MKKKLVQIIGAGTMGSGIAVCAAMNNHRTILIDSSQQQLKLGLEKVRLHTAQLVEAGLASIEEAEKAISLIGASLQAEEHMDETFLIIEAIYENLEAKQALFSSLDTSAPQDVIIASNTSGMRISDIARYTEHPERTATTHFWFPGHLVPLVEIVKGDKTSQKTAEFLRDLLLAWGKAPVIVQKDLPGQLANRILQAIIREAVNIVETGLASAEDVDTAIKMGMALRFPAWGPLEHIDAVGLDLAYSVQKDVLPGLQNSPAPSPMLQSLVESGNLGHKTGNGIYDWNKKDMKTLANQRDRFIIGALKLLKQSE